MSAAEIVVVVAVVCFGAFIKSITGVGLPSIAVPVIALFTSVEDAVVVIALPAFVMNLALIARHRVGAGKAVHLPVLVGAGIVGAAVGTFLLKELDDQVLLLVLAVVVVGYIATNIVSTNFTWPAGLIAPASPAVGLAAGVLQGAAGISGPLIGTWLHGLRLGRDGFIYAMTLLFLVNGAVQFVVLGALGLYTSGRVAATVLTVIPAAVMLPIGGWVGKRMAPAIFDRLVLVLLACSAVALLIRAWL